MIAIKRNLKSYFGTTSQAAKKQKQTERKRVVMGLVTRRLTKKIYHSFQPHTLVNGIYGRKKAAEE